MISDDEEGRATAVRKRSVRIAGHPTSVSLEAAFWEALKEIAAARGQSLNALITEVDETRALDPDGGGNLSSALRVWALDWFRNGA